MSHTKEQLIEILTPALVKSTATTAKEVHAVLETYELEGLKKELARQRKAGSLRTPVEDPEDVAIDPDIIRKVEAIRAEARDQYDRDPENIRRQQAFAAEIQASTRDYHMFQIFNVVVNGKRPVRNQASEGIVISWLNPGETLSVDWYIKVLQENPKLADQLQWRSAKVDIKADYNTFKEAARLFNYAVNEANFGLITRALGSNFSASDIGAAISAGELNLAVSYSGRLQERWRSEGQSNFTTRSC